MHWYVVERYHSQLAKLDKTWREDGRGRSSPPLPSTEDQVGGAYYAMEAAARDQVGGANDAEEATAREGEEDPSQPLSLVPINNRKWLKGVALNKVQVSGTSSGSRRSSVDFAESAQPYLSVYERDGLLALVQEMLGSELFIPDAPHTNSNPKQMLKELSEQLQCSNVERTCAARPTGVGLVPAQPVSRGSGHVGSRKKGASSTTNGTPRKRGRKVDEDGVKRVKVQKKDEKTSKRKAASKRKRKPLLVSVPKSLMKSALGEDREEIAQDCSKDDCEINVSEKVAITGNIELVPNKIDQDVAIKDEEGFEVVGLKSAEQLDSVALAGQILTPPMSLSSASADSISPSPSPSPIPPSSPLTPSSSHPFTLKLELDSPIAPHTTPLSQTTPISRSTTLHLVSQQTNKDSPDTLSIESPMLTKDSLSE